ncbi:hypothetical protein D3C84_1245070 [compost metagenome]
MMYAVMYSSCCLIDQYDVAVTPHQLDNNRFEGNIAQLVALSDIHMNNPFILNLPDSFN